MQKLEFDVVDPEDLSGPVEAAVRLAEQAARQRGWLDASSAG